MPITANRHSSAASPTSARAIARAASRTQSARSDSHCATVSIVARPLRSRAAMPRRARRYAMRRRSSTASWAPEATGTGLAGSAPTATRRSCRICRVDGATVRASASASTSHSELMARDEVAERLGHPDDLDEATTQVAVGLERRHQPPPGGLVARLQDPHEQEQCEIGVGGHPDVHEHVTLGVLARQQGLEPRSSAQPTCLLEILESQSDEAAGVGAAPGAHESRWCAHTRSPHARVTGRHAAMRSPSAASTSSATTSGSMPDRPSASSG